MDDVRYRLELSLPPLSFFLYSLTARLFNPYDEPWGPFKKIVTKDIYLIVTLTATTFLFDLRTIAKASQRQFEGPTWGQLYAIQFKGSPWRQF